MRSKAIVSIALEQISPAVTIDEFQKWLSLDNTDNLSMLINSATSSVVEYIGLELINRKRRLIYETLPYEGTINGLNISGDSFNLIRPIPLLYSGLKTTLEQTLYFGNDITSKCEILEGRPSGLLMPRMLVLNHSGKNALDITYTAGFGTIDDVPYQIKEAVLMLAAFNYENRGACSVTDALAQSGAAKSLERFRVYPEVM